MLLCNFCNRECINPNSLRNHERLCKENPNRQIMTGYNPRNTGKVGKNQHTKAKELGTVYVVSQETRDKLSKAATEQNATKWTDEQRHKHSIVMREAVLNNPESYTSNNVCGRVKIEDYKGEKFHGKWELMVAKWFDSNSIRWERKIKPFNYFWNNKWHLYFPDFYLPDLDKYVEVKGFKRERDVCKWSVVPNLLVLQKKEIEEIQKGSFVLG
jgi:hypothetical protein